MAPTTKQQSAIHRGQALALCWLLQQPLGEGGDLLEGLTRTLAFSRPVFLQIIADYKPLAGIEIVECAPPYDAAEITAIMSTRVICDVLACQVRSGHLPNRKKR